MEIDSQSKYICCLKPAHCKILLYFTFNLLGIEILIMLACGKDCTERQNSTVGRLLVEYEMLIVYLLLPNYNR